MFISIILIAFCIGFFSEKINIKNDELVTNIAKWSFNSSNTEKMINISNEKIFPGSKGEFEIELDATGAETDIEYKILVLEEKNIPSNFEFYAETINSKGEIIDKTDKYQHFSELANNKLFESIAFDKNNQTRKIKVYWFWKDENVDDLLNIKDGTLVFNENNESSLDCNLKIEIIGKQI